MLRNYFAVLCTVAFISFGTSALAEEPAPTTATTEVAAPNNPETKTLEGDAKPVETILAQDAKDVETAASPEKDLAPVNDAEAGQLSDAQLTQAIDTLISTIANGGGALAILALILMILAGVLKKYVLTRLSISKKWTPIVTMGVSCVGAVGYCLFSGTPVMEALSTVALATAAAVGGYEMAVKHVMALTKNEEAEA
jgi:hypothetical protein